MSQTNTKLQNITQKEPINTSNTLHNTSQNTRTNSESQVNSRIRSLNSHTTAPHKSNIINAVPQNITQNKSILEKSMEESNKRRLRLLNTDGNILTTNHANENNMQGPMIDDFSFLTKEQMDSIDLIGTLNRLNGGKRKRNMK